MVKIDLDMTDIKIINSLLNDPNISHRTIAKEVNKSQPSISARIKKYKELGLLRIQSGIDLQNGNFFLVLVNLLTKKSNNIMQMAKYCPFIVNAFRISGKYNLFILLASTKLEKLYKVVNNHFRINQDIKKISMQIIIESAKNFIATIGFDNETLAPYSVDGCSVNCKYCKNNKLMRYKEIVND